MMFQGGNDHEAHHRDRRLTPEEAAKYKAIREQIAAELPDLIARHHDRMAKLDQR